MSQQGCSHYYARLLRVLMIIDAFKVLNCEMRTCEMYLQVNTHVHTHI